MTVIDMDYMVYFHFFGCIIVPLILITVMYSCIFYTIRKQLKYTDALKVQSASTDKHINTSNRFKKEVKMAKTFAIVIIMFAFCWIPIDILNTMFVMCGTSCPYPIELLLVTIVLSHANSAVNPVIYTYTNSNFKLAFKKMFGMKKEDSVITNTGSNTASPINTNEHVGKDNVAFETDQRIESTSSTGV